MPDQDWQPNSAWPPAPRGWQFYVDEEEVTLPSAGNRGRAVHDAARLRSGRRPSWYARKRILLPVIAGVAVLSFAAGQESQRSVQSGNEVSVADAPASPSSSPASTPTATPAKPRPSAKSDPPPSKRSSPSRTTRAATEKPASQPKRKADRPRAEPRPAKPEPKPKKSCDPNYAEACVPIADDVDCAEGGGNGPAYLSEAAKIVGNDIYDLDRDGDGYGCEPW